MQQLVPNVLLAIGLTFSPCLVPMLARADDAVELKAALAQPILPPGAPHQEVRAFVSPRIQKFSPPADRAAWERMAKQVRHDMLERIVFRGSAAPWRDARCDVAWLDTVDGGPGYRIRKFRYEALRGMWIPGLLYLPDNPQDRMPVAIHVNGHAAEGKSVDYKQLRSIHLAKRGMLVLNVEWFGMGQLRTPGFVHGRMNQLDLCGASGLAPFYLALSRAVDIAASLDHADPQRIAVAGLSGGGWQTILISSLDERVALANPVAGYGSYFTNIGFEDMGDSEQAPADMATVADYAHLTALRAPRPTLLTYNAKDDCCFKSGHTLEPLLAAASPVFALYGSHEKLRSHVNYDPGTHNFDKENREQYYALVGDFFYPDDKTFARAEIPSASEIRSARELEVPLPADNVDFHRLAQTLMAALPPKPQPPAEPPAAEDWRQARRQQLKALLRVPSYDAVAAGDKTSTIGDYRLTSRTLRIGSDWSVPTIEVATPAAANKTAIVVADAGRTSVAEQIGKFALDGWRVVAIDPLFWGESKIQAQDPDYTYSLFVAAVGERPLGIQAAQLVAAARWARAEGADGALKLVAFGPRASMAALVAAALAPSEITAVETTDSLASLKDLIHEDKPVEELPELFAFGLLREFDVADIRALIDPRPVIARPPEP